jgi:hypothetical protein
MCDRIRGWRRFFLPYGGYTKIVHFTRTGLHCMNGGKGKERKGITDIGGGGEKRI